MLNLPSHHRVDTDDKGIWIVATRFPLELIHGDIFPANVNTVLVIQKERLINSLISLE